jgi:hypothetical protein
MSRDVWIEIVLKKDFSKETIHRILKCGEQVGCKYVNSKDDTSITAVQALELAYSSYDVPQSYADEIRNLPCVEFQYLDTFCRLIFSSDNKIHNTEILLSIWGNRWFKGDPDDEMIDWARYIQLVLALCQDFPILELKTDDTSFQP